MKTHPQRQLLSGRLVGGSRAVPCRILLIHANISSLRIPVWQVRWGICFFPLFVLFFFSFFTVHIPAGRAVAAGRLLRVTLF